MNFGDRVVEAVRRAGNPIMVGVDPRPEELPSGFLDRYEGDRAGVASALEAFGRGVVDAVAGLVPIVKFQAAFYEAYGPEGVAALHASTAHARRAGLLVVLDGKRNDIGSTAEAYARAYLGKVAVGTQFLPSWDVDALTINPYLGTDGVAPFVKVAAREGKGVFVLVRTSNPSAVEFQDLVSGGRPLYRHVADKLAGWAAPHVGSSGYGAIGAVAGATYPGQLAELRAALPGVLLLVPGYGAQGGSATDVSPAFEADGLGALINNSRGLAFAYNRPALREAHGDDWQGAIAQAVREMADDLAAHTPSARLRAPGARPA